MKNQIIKAVSDETNEIFAVKDAESGAAVRYTTTVDDAALFNAVNGTSESVKNYMDKDIIIKDIVITSADVHDDKEDDESPVHSKPCVHFYTTDDKHIASLSNGIIRSAKALINCGFTPTIERPITIRFKTVETKKGTAHTFDLVSR